jgi:hypothetical protein
MQEIAPVANEIVNVQANVTSTAGINRVNLYYATGIVGNFIKVQMFDDGTHNDGSLGDGIFGASIPGFSSNTFVRYYIEAIANNTALSASYLPTGAEHDIFVYRVQASQLPNGVVINEIMASNTTTATDEVGEFEDWIELYNNNSTPVDLSGFYLSDDSANLTKWQIPAGTTIDANGYLIFWADDEQADGPSHTSWKLSAAGEEVFLSDASQSIADSMTFGAQTTDMGFARVPNGIGDFLIQAPTFNANNQTLSTESFELDAMVVYPNPASTTLSIINRGALEGSKVILYNALGQKVYEAAALPEMNINTDNFSNGVYILNCNNYNKKIIIKN